MERGMFRQAPLRRYFPERTARIVDLGEGHDLPTATTAPGRQPAPAPSARTVGPTARWRIRGSAGWVRPEERQPARLGDHRCGRAGLHLLLHQLLHVLG